MSRFFIMNIYGIPLNEEINPDQILAKTLKINLKKFATKTLKF